MSLLSRLQSFFCKRQERQQENPVRKIIFLDFDNNPEKDEFGVFYDPNYVAVLKHIVDKTDAAIVVSPSWVELRMLQTWWKAQDLPGKLIDKTPPIGRCRGDEIAAWLTLCPDHCQYVIIDNQPSEQFHTDQYRHLITTSGWNGLTMELADIAIEILNHH